MPKRLAALRREIGLLRTQFLPEPFDPLGTYVQDARVQAHTRAFLVLSHAELESFLEEWAREIAKACEKVWAKSSRIPAPMAFLLSWNSERLVLEDTLSAPGAKDSHAIFADVITRLFARYYKSIKDNNGIKERNVLAMFGPIGVPVTAFPPTLLPNLDALGSIRGTHAHHSGKAVRSVLDPETEYKRLDSILNDLQAFDQWLVTYKSKIR
jgi:hypothetical protein